MMGAVSPLTQALTDKCELRADPAHAGLRRIEYMSTTDNPTDDYKLSYRNSPKSPFFLRALLISS